MTEAHTAEELESEAAEARQLAWLLGEYRVALRGVGFHDDVVDELVTHYQTYRLEMGDDDD